MTDLECYRRIVAVQLRALVEIGETVKDRPTGEALHDALDVIDPPAASFRAGDNGQPAAPDWRD